MVVAPGRITLWSSRLGLVVRPLLLDTKRRRRHQLSQQGRSQGDVEHSDNSSSQPRAEKLETAGGRGAANKGIARNNLKRSLTTPTADATSVVLSATTGGTERRSRGDEDERQDRNDERLEDGNGATYSNTSSSGVSMLVPSIISSGTGKMGNTRQPRRSTLSTTGSDVSSDGENERSDAQAPEAAARSEATPTTASAAKTPLVSRTRGDCDQTKELGDEGQEDALSNRDQESWGVGGDSKGEEGTSPRGV